MSKKYAMIQARSAWSTAQHAKELGMWVSYFTFIDIFHAYMRELRHASN